MTAYIVTTVDLKGKSTDIAPAKDLITARKIAYRYGWGVRTKSVGTPKFESVLIKRLHPAMKDEVIGEIYPAVNGEYMVWRNFDEGTYSVLLSTGKVRDTRKAR